MKLVTFSTDKDKNLIVQFPVFIQPYTQQLLILYQIKTVPVPIIDQNTQAHSYTHLQVDRPYIALNSERYITIRQQELRMWKRIGYEFYCEELFVVKHKSKYSCESAIYFEERYITIRQQELRMCKRIGYEFYCEELFVVKHKSKYSCESAIYFDLDPEIIKENCMFNFSYNKTDITPTALDGGNKIMLANLAQ